MRPMSMLLMVVQMEQDPKHLLPSSLLHALLQLDLLLPRQHLDLN